MRCLPIVATAVFKTTQKLSRCKLLTYNPRHSLISFDYLMVFLPDSAGVKASLKPAGRPGVGGVHTTD
jgi:hypothetical protein